MASRAPRPPVAENTDSANAAEEEHGPSKTIVAGAGTYKKAVSPAPQADLWKAGASYEELDYLAELSLPAKGLSHDLLGLVTPAASAVLMGGMVITGTMAGTSTAAPILPACVRHEQGTSSGSRVFYTNRDGIIADLLGYTGKLPAGSLANVMKLSSDLLPDVDVPTAILDLGETQEVQETPAEPVLSAADEVRWLHDVSGLTWDQLGKAFGVSRRAVHMWVNGHRLNATNAERLARLVAIVRELPGNSPDERRAALLTPGKSGTSILDTFRMELEARGTVTGTPYTPGQLVGARHDTVADST